MIRKAKKSDIKRLYKIIHDCIKFVRVSKRMKTRLRKKYTLAGIKKLFKISDIFVCEKNNVVQGCGRLEKNKIWTVYVNPKKHRRRIGTAIMDKLESFAKSKGKKKVSLEALKPAKGFYIKRNYKLIKITSDHYLMEKRLK
jgi:N-acetylglutamate synthase-like GNAT family acetyltransferase